MKTLKRMLYVPVLVALSLVALMVVAAVSMAAQPPVNLGTTSSFAVLAGETVTNTGLTTIWGDLGVSPGSAFSDLGTVTLHGATHLADAVALQAQSDLVAAYDDAAGRTPFNTIPVELGGRTLTPGVYVSDAEGGDFQITGTLTLDAKGDPNAVFIFKSASTLITASDSRVRLINGARFCRVFWQVTSSVTLGTNSHFVGHVFALTSIAAETGATVQGQLLARNGAVTLDTNTITNGFCATITPSSSATPTGTGTPTGPGLPTTGLAPDANGLPWQIPAGIFVVSVILLLAAWRLRAASIRRH
jgi:hypothetical protein